MWKPFWKIKNWFVDAYLRYNHDDWDLYWCSKWCALTNTKLCLSGRRKKRKKK